MDILIIDNELFELCKQVYERTKWEDDTGFYLYQISGEDEIKRSLWFNSLSFKKDDKRMYVIVPLYTSDYLLDKLPTGVQVHKDSPEYGAYRPHEYSAQPVRAKVTQKRIRWNADSPLKALLLLTLALHKEGLL